MRTRLLLPLLALPALVGCQSFLAFFGKGDKAGGGGGPAAEKPLTIRSFSETTTVTAVQPVQNNLYVGTARGLIKWDVAKASSTTLTAANGLPSDKIGALASDGKGGLWVMTDKGVSHDSNGSWQNAPAVPVGAFVSGLVQTDDGTLWAGGPEGLGRLQKGTWLKFLGDTQVTALEAAGGDVWLGTAGKGVLRVHNDTVEVFGNDQGNEVDVVRGIAATPSGVMVIGEGPGGQRAAFFDGKRFFSYKVESQKGVLEWIKRVADHVLIGSGSQVFAIARLQEQPKEAPASGVRLVASEVKPSKPPLFGPARADLSTIQPPPESPKEKAEKAKEKPKDEGPAPIWAVNTWGPRLPDGVTTVGTDGLTLFVGTRFLGASRVDETGLTHFRTYDLARDAERLSVACQGDSDCWVATGTERAWHFDGQSFGTVQVDPEPGARVLALLNQPRGSVLAIHRGAKDPLLRLSQASSDGSTWVPISATEVQVPSGAPDVTFATFAPTQHLWLGLRYIDKDGDKNDYGAAEVDLDAGQVTYHRQEKGLSPKSLQLPNDLEAAYFVDGNEAWFGARTGAVHVKGRDLQIFTENDGLESEYIHDVITGTDGTIWVATSRGIGRYDGTRWTFPHEGDNLRVKATSLAKDGAGSVFVGTTTGLIACAPAKVEKLDSERGLLDNSVLDLAVDKRGRVWVLTEKGISIVDR